MVKRTENNDELSERRRRRRRQMNRDDSNQASIESQQSADSDNNIIDMMTTEKVAAMDPIKSRSMSISLYPANRDTAAPDAMADEEQGADDQGNNEQDFPGAYRVARGEVLNNGGQSVETSSVYSEGSASCVIVVPRASVVNEKKEEARGNDVEGQITEIPLAIAERNYEASDHLTLQSTKSGKRKSKLLKISLLICLSLVAILLGGILFVLLRPEHSNSNHSLERTEAPLLPDEDGRTSGDGDGDRDSHKYGDWKPPGSGGGRGGGRGGD